MDLVYFVIYEVKINTFKEYAFIAEDFWNYLKNW